MYNGNHIKELLAAQSRTNKELLNYLGVEGNSSLTQLTKGNPTAQKLEKIADFFGVSIDEFFIRDCEFTSSTTLMDEVNYLKEMILLLKKLLNDKEKIIKLLEDKAATSVADEHKTSTLIK